jgi:hypothetical protein
MDESQIARLRKAAEYQREAADCRERAERASHPGAKQEWLKIAERWMELARLADAHHPGRSKELRSAPTD